MKTIAIGATAAVLLISPAVAEPMLCSGDFNKACMAECLKPTNRATAPSCLTNCRVLVERCKHSGCWEGPTNRYCGLNRK